jgi:hypothetical protein
MKSLLWKEWRENVKWLPLPTLLILAPIGLFGLAPLMDEAFLFFVMLVAAVFGAALGFVQIYFESTGDKRALLLHRPLSSSHIFLGKTIVGVGLYLVAIGIPFVVVLRLAATPGHIPQPFEWPMVLPWLADALTGLVFYFAGMLMAQREGRWYGSRCLGLAAGMFCWYLVWTLPEFWHALLAIAIVGAFVALAAWGSFDAGGRLGRHGPSALARIALGVTFLMGLSALSVTGKALIGVWCWPKTAHYYRLDRQGHVLCVHEEKENGQLHLTDLEGKVPAEIENVPLDPYALRQITSPWAQGEWPRTRSYRNSNRALVKYGNDTELGNEWWWYVPAQGRLLGYDKPSRRHIGSFGPDGFAGPDRQPERRFMGELLHTSRLYSARADQYLVFPAHVYKVDFRKRSIDSIFVPSEGETVHWASHWEDEELKIGLAFVLTDKKIHVANDAGSRILSIPLAQDLAGYQVEKMGRLESPRRYWVWYEPPWFANLEELETLPAYLLVYDSSGQEITPRQEIAPRPGLPREIKPRMPLVDGSAVHAWSGLLTPPAEAAVLIGATQQLLSEVRKSQGTRTDALLQVLVAMTQPFLPGVRWFAPAHPGLAYGFLALMLLSAAGSAVACFVLARRYAFSRAGCAGWTVCGFSFGWAGLCLMFALQEWPARVVCPKCRKLRVVTRDACEHCGALHATPARDGTEIFEPAAPAALAAMAGH